MKIAELAKQSDGRFAWIMGDRTVAEVYSVNGVWHSRWLGELEDSQWHRLLQEFPCAHDACLAVEKLWPPQDQYFGGWLESKNGGYFRKFAKAGTVYVRNAEDGWYAVQTDGKLLGKGKNMSWFATAMDACRAVEKEKYTPVDADPFVNNRDQWQWIKFRKAVGAA
jgi:hypothetical protein